MRDPQDDATEEFSPLEQLCICVLHLAEWDDNLPPLVTREMAEQSGRGARRIAALLKDRFEVAAVSEQPQTMTGVAESLAPIWHAPPPSGGRDPWSQEWARQGVQPIPYEDLLRRSIQPTRWPTQLDLEEMFQRDREACWRTLLSFRKPGGTQV